MKIDLINIYPGIVLETQKTILGEPIMGKDGWISRRYDKLVIDPQLKDYLKIDNSIILSYKKMQNTPRLVSKEIREKLNKVQSLIYDTELHNLDDFTIVIAKDFSVEGFGPPKVTNFQHFLTFFVNLNNFEDQIIKDCVNIFSIPKYGYEIYLDNNKKINFYKYLYILPKNKNNIIKIELRKNGEILFLKTLSRIYEKDKSKFNRIVNAVTLYNESFRLNKFNKRASIVLLVSAFETLLSLPQPSKRETFSYAISLFWLFNKRIEKWADGLYQVRSKIVHGEVLDDIQLFISEDRHCLYIDVAQKMFYNLILLILEGWGYIFIKEPEFKKVNANELVNLITSNKEKVTNILNQKSKLSYKSFLNKKDIYKEFILEIERLTMTDYSAKDLIKDLLKIIYNITKDWVNDDKNRLLSIKNKRKDDKSILEYCNFIEQKYINILNIFDDVLRSNNSIQGRFNLREKLLDLREEVRRLESIMHKKKEFRFTLSEFLARTLESITWAI
jgi:hypothetical protein